MAQQVAKILHTQVGGVTAYAWYQENGSLPIVAPDVNGIDWSLYNTSKTKTEIHPDYDHKQGYKWYGPDGKSVDKSRGLNQNPKQ